MMSASASAPAPTSSGPMGETSPDSVVVSATCCVPPGPAVLVLPGGPGVRLGNSMPALSPGLSVGVEAAMPGRGWVVTPIGAGGGRTVTVPDAAGFVRRPAALTVAVRVTDVTASAGRGTVTCASSCRWVAAGSIALRLHAGVLSSFAQPTVNFGVPLPAGVTRSAIVASGTVPPVVQAATSQAAALPRSLLCCSGSTSTHRLAVVAAVRMMRWPELAPADADSDADVVGVAVLGAGVGVGVVGVGDGAGVVGVTVVWVGAGVDVAGELGGGVVGEANGVGEVVLGAGAGVVAAAVGDGEPVVFLAVGVRVGVAARTRRGSHDWPPAAALAVTVVNIAAAAVPVAAASMPGQAATSRAAPARNAPVVRRARADRISGPRSPRSFHLHYASLDGTGDFSRR